MSLPWCGMAVRPEVCSADPDTYLVQEAFLYGRIDDSIFLSRISLDIWIGFCGQSCQWWLLEAMGHYDVC